MGNYLKKIERDYIDGKISLDEKENLTRMNMNRHPRSIKRNVDESLCKD